MSRRQKEDKDDGLDLFLDAICNTFGGIIFIAILTVLMSMFRENQDDASPPPAPSTDQFRAAQLELDAAAARFDTLTASVRALRVAPGVEVDPRLAELVSQIESAEDDRVDAQKERAATTARIADTREEIAEQVKAREAVGDVVEAAEKELIAAKSKWDQTKEAKIESLSVPRERFLNAARGILLLKHEKVYLGSLPEDPADRFQEGFVKVKKTSPTSYELTPRPAKGIRLDSKRAAAAFKEVARRLRGQRSPIIIVVWPDSYKWFPSVRETLKAERVYYQLWVHNDQPHVDVSIGMGSRSAQ
ncbi:MAG: hypothetical protein AAF958_01215 [Planctomycetota bacterium]